MCAHASDFCYDLLCFCLFFLFVFFFSIFFKWKFQNVCLISVLANVTRSTVKVKVKVKVKVTNPLTAISGKRHLSQKKRYPNTGFKHCNVTFCHGDEPRDFHRAYPRKLRARLISKTAFNNLVPRIFVFLYQRLLASDPEQF